MLKDRLRHYQSIEDVDDGAQLQLMAITLLQNHYRREMQHLQDPPNGKTPLRLGRENKMLNEYYD